MNDVEGNCEEADEIIWKGELEYLVASGFVVGTTARSRQREKLFDIFQQNHAIDTNRAHPPDQRERCLERVVQVTAHV